MPRQATWSVIEAMALRQAGMSYAEIATRLGVSGESTVREGIRRYTGGTRNTARSHAARTATAARWGGARPSSSARTFGVEIEFHTAIRRDVVAAVEAVVGYHIHMTAYHGRSCVTCGGEVRGYRQWKLETDSSATSGMRNAGAYPHNQGGELVSPVLAGQAGLDELTRVMAALRSVGAKVDRRHGMHVHLGVADMSKEQRINLLRNYKTLQPFLYRMVAPSRRNNMYCRAVNGNVLDGWMNAIWDGRILGGNHTDGLNVSKISQIGTIEMRMHQGTLNAKKATQWVKLLVALFDASANHVEFDGVDTIGHLQRGGMITAADANWYRNRHATLNPAAIAA